MNEEIVKCCKVQIPGTEAYRNEIEPAFQNIAEAFVDEGWEICTTSPFNRDEGQVCIYFRRGPILESDFAIVDLQFRAPASYWVGEKWHEPRKISVRVTRMYHGTSVRSVLYSEVSYDRREHPAEIYDGVADNLVPAMDRMVHAIRGTCEYM